ncbi:hypothetical protein [Salinicola rhizosphaerae]|uniref:Uncharacterized protein n=1 Tax=Salinicola rhizosphaerae TaxID=1443141 RepID=A0ABQ3DSB8_9GAMM|nr:hypothetical protein [Salinicola rhizosphaerae]GHB13042.1 hypothetical protein GCM10009038_08890 [Salinicola rhizosphaerae]
MSLQQKKEINIRPNCSNSEIDRELAGYTVNEIESKNKAYEKEIFYCDIGIIFGGGLAFMALCEVVTPIHNLMSNPTIHLNSNNVLDALISNPLCLFFSLLLQTIMTALIAKNIKLRSLQEALRLGLKRKIGDSKQESCPVSEIDKELAKQKTVVRISYCLCISLILFIWNADNLYYIGIALLTMLTIARFNSFLESSLKRKIENNKGETS